MHRAQKLGLGTAYIAGFKWALERDYAYMFEMDADFSHDPAHLPMFLKAIEDADLVLGSRYNRGKVTVVNWPIRRLMLSYAANLYARWVTGLPLDDSTGGFKCFRRSVLQAIDLDSVRSNGYGFQIEVSYLAWRKDFQDRRDPDRLPRSHRGAEQNVPEDRVRGDLDGLAAAVAHAHGQDLIVGRRFWKMSGSGNDFVVFDSRGSAAGAEPLERPEVIRALCARGTGVGADGVVFVAKPGRAEATLAMRYYNSDGSRGAFCGNATLCVATLARGELGLARNGRAGARDRQRRRPGSFGRDRPRDRSAGRRERGDPPWMCSTWTPASAAWASRWPAFRISSCAATTLNCARRRARPGARGARVIAPRA